MSPAAATPAPAASSERGSSRLGRLAALYPFASHWLELEAGRYHYVDEGPRDADTLLCVHGNPTWSFYWRRLISAFRRTHRVVAPDHLGCGLSDKPQDWSYALADHVANLERLVVALDLKRVTLVVHDWGGAIGMGLALRQPQRIARLVITNTAAFPDPRIPLRIRVCRTPVLGRFLVRRLNAFSGLLPVFGAETRLAPEVRDGLLLPYDSYAHRVAVHRFVRDIPMSPSHASFPELARIEAGLAAFQDRPTCIVWGERDWCFTPRFREEWERRFPGARVHRIEAAGHLVLEDAPEEVELAVRAFLRETVA